VSYSAQPVFKHLSWDIHKDRCVGLVGPNGAGKSSLLKLISGELVTESGYANSRGKLSIGYLQQEPRLHPKHTLLQEALTASTHVPRLQRALTQVETELGKPEIYSDEKKLIRKIDEQARLLEEYQTRLATATEGLVGSDIEGVCQRAAMLAIREYVNHYGKDAQSLEVATFQVTAQHFEQALHNLGGGSR